MEPSRLSSIELVVPKDPRRPSPPDAKVEVAVSLQLDLLLRSYSLCDEAGMVIHERVLK
jgi:hypothetical protein